MGPSPPYSSPSSQAQSFSRAGDLFFNTSHERDTLIFTQALTHELSSSRGALASSFSSSSPSPAAATSATCSSSPFSESLSRGFDGSDFWQSSAGLSVPRAMQQQHQQTQMAAMFSGQLRRDGFLHTEQNSLSPFPSNSPSPVSAPKERPESPFSNSTLSTSSTISMANTESLLAHIKPNNQVTEDGIFASTNASLNNASDMSNLCHISSSTASIALSSQASMGAAHGKVIKRRSRASSKSPIAVISADASNFRAMVQHLTGISPSTSSHPYGSSGMPVLKPQPSRHPYTNTVNLPTLDTSACFLGPKPMMKSTLQGYSFVQRPHQISSSPLSALDLTRVQGQNVDGMSQSDPHHNNFGLSSCSPSPQTMQSLWDFADSGKSRGNVEQFALREAPIVSENLQIEEHPPTKSPFNSVDSWLSFDGALANHTSNMELARMA